MAAIVPSGEPDGSGEDEAPDGVDEAVRQSPNGMPFRMFQWEMGSVVLDMADNSVGLVDEDTRGAEVIAGRIETAIVNVNELPYPFIEYLEKRGIRMIELPPEDSATSGRLMVTTP